MKHGEVPTAFVVRANGHTDTTEDEIKQFVSKEVLGSFKKGPIYLGKENVMIWNYLEDGSYLNKKHLKIEIIVSSIWYPSDADIWWWT
ncbi:hypothetical protein AAHE18_12G195400 [Arachis hypogaea]